MRIDKYLWCVRLYKTRSLATEVVRADKVLMGDAAVKASRDMRPGDTFTIKQHGFTQKFQVIDLPKSRVGAKLLPDYLKDLTLPEEYEKRDFLLLAKNMSRERGLGRPTKKDRRALDNFDVE